MNQPKDPETRNSPDAMAGSPRTRGTDFVAETELGSTCGDPTDEPPSTTNGGSPANLTDEEVVAGISGTGIVERATPRTLWFGLRWRG